MPKKTKKIQVGNKLLSYGRQLVDMVDSTDLYLARDFTTLRHRLESQGYIFVRNVINSDAIADARSAMLQQAANDGSVMFDEDMDVDEARIAREGKKWAESYCLDGITGAETNEREGIDEEEWMELGPSDVMQNVYNGEDVRNFWANLFGIESMKPLVKQTFLRLMGWNCGTIEHADYYYFKRDTDVFSDQDGRDAMDAAERYLKGHDLWDESLFELKEEEEETRADASDEECDQMTCGICLKTFDVDDLPPKKMKRLTVGDFGVNGEWHCPSCALKPMSIYTTWISLSNAKPANSILALAPGTHRLCEWDMPKRNGQVPSDFNWKYKWEIPTHVEPGDIIIFNVKTVHAASKNTSRPARFRVSFDTRIQLVPDVEEDVSRATPRVRKTKSMRARASPHPGLKFVAECEGNDDDEVDGDVEMAGAPLRDAKNVKRKRRSRARRPVEDELTSGVESLRL